MSQSAINQVRGRTIVLRGNDIDTDRIIPARFLKAVTFEGLEHSVFADDRQEAARAGHMHPFDDASRLDARVLLVDANFGCGSSREHAPQALFRRGIRAIVGLSFAEIFFGNSVALGLPCLVVTAADGAALMNEAERDPGAECVVDLAALTVQLGPIAARAGMPETARTALRSGTWNVTSLLLERYEEVERVAAGLPYLRDFRVTPG